MLEDLEVVTARSWSETYRMREMCLGKQQTTRALCHLYLECALLPNSPWPSTASDVLCFQIPFTGCSDRICPVQGVSTNIAGRFWRLV